MREIMERNELDARRRRQLHLHAHRRPRRRVPGGRRARHRASTSVPLLCAREIPVPGALPRVIRVLMHYYADEGHEAAARVPRRGARAARRPRRARSSLRPWPSSSPQRVAPHPRLPGRRRLRAARGRRAAGLQRVARPAAARRSSRRSQRALTGAQPLPGPDERARCARRSATATACPPTRIAIGNGSCDILLAAGEALLEPGRRARLRVAVVQRLPAPRRPRRARRAITVPLNDARRARPRRDGRARSPPPRGWSSSATRTTRRRPRCRSTTIAAFVERGPAPRLRDPRRGLLRVQHCSTTPTRRSTCSTQHPNLVLLRTFSKVYGLCGLRVGYALCGSRGVRHGRRPGPPAVLLQRRRPGRRDRGAQAPGRGRRARRARDRRARRASRTGSSELGHRASPSRRRTSAGSHLPDDERRARPTSSRGLARARRARPRRARRSGARARCASPTARRSENERFLDGAGRAAAEPGYAGRAIVRTTAAAAMSRMLARDRRRSPSPRCRVATPTPGDLARRSAGTRVAVPHRDPRAERRSAAPCQPRRVDSTPGVDRKDQQHDDRDEADGHRGRDPGRHRAHRVRRRPRAPQPRRGGHRDRRHRRPRARRAPRARGRARASTSVVPILKPYKLASTQLRHGEPLGARDRRPQDRRRALRADRRPVHRRVARPDARRPPTSSRPPARRCSAAAPTSRAPRPYAFQGLGAGGPAAARRGQGARPACRSSPS